jgi:hypothetical protein
MASLLRWTRSSPVRTFGIAAPQDARAEFCEPNGISYQARHLEITQVEEKIATLGMMTVMGQDLTNKSGKAKEIERSQGDAALMSVAMQAQDAIDTCIGFHAAYLGLATNAHCEVNRDFFPSGSAVMKWRRSSPCTTRLTR